jgi:hypothetical protein
MKTLGPGGTACAPAPARRLVACVGSAASALTIEYARDRAPDLVKCDQLVPRPARRAHASFGLTATSTDSRIKADAACERRRAANSFLQAGEGIPQTQCAPVGRLLRCDAPEQRAVKLFRKRRVDESYAPAKLGLAKVAAGRFDEKAQGLANEVIEKTPDSAIEAYLLLARTELEDGAVADAEAKLDKALAIAEREKITPLEIYALKASADLLRDKTDSAWTPKALALDKAYGDIYATPAYFTRDHAPRLPPEAIEAVPQGGRDPAGQLRGPPRARREPAPAEQGRRAQQHLMVAYRGDPYSAPSSTRCGSSTASSTFVASPHRRWT